MDLSGALTKSSFKTSSVILRSESDKTQIEYCNLPKLSLQQLRIL